MKIIQINSFSHSLVMKDYEQDILKNWYAQVAYKIKETHKKTKIECWTIERFYKKESIKENKDIEFRIFPTNFSLRHGMEISFSMLRALREEIKRSKRNKEKLIIHLQGYHSWQVYLILFFLNGNFVGQHHGGRSPLKNLQKYKRFFLALPIVLLMQLCESTLLKKIKVFYSLSNAETSYLKKITNSKIKFQAMGIDEKDYKSTNKSLTRKKLKLKNYKYLVYLGRIKKTKGIKELLEAMAEIKDEQIKLLLLGEGEDYQKYKEYAKKLSLKNTQFVGPVYGKRKFLYLRAANALILPSHTEGAPVALMEAVASNIPVIATRVGGVTQMIKNNHEGLLIGIKSKEQIKFAIKQIMQWKGQNIKQHAQKYFWKNIIKSTMDDYLN